MSSSYTFVLCIIAIVMGASIIRTYLNKKSQRPEFDAEMEETLAKIDDLEERIQVLERIITENRFDLKKEIENL